MSIKVAKILAVSVLGAILSLSPSVAMKTEDTTKTFAGALVGEPLWETYRGRFLKADGRIIDTANANVSHSEGQGYGMILALAAGDRQAFEKMYAFAKKTLGIRSDRLFAWRYDPNKSDKVSDLNNASDGDILIAWALLEAANAGWGEAYGNEALAILSDLSPQLDDYTSFGLVIRPGEHGFLDEENETATLNASYWIFPAIERIAALTGDRRWTRLVSSGEQLVEQLMAVADGGVPDWAVLSKQNGTLQFDEKRSTEFGYDAIRVPLYMLMASSVDARLADALIDKMSDENRTVLKRIDLKSKETKGKFETVGYRSIVSLANCVSSDRTFASDVRSTLDQHYYPATLQLLALMTAKKGYPQCL